MNTSTGPFPGAQDKGSGNTASIADRLEVAAAKHCNSDQGNLLGGSGSNVRAVNARAWRRTFLTISAAALVLPVSPIVAGIAAIWWWLH